MALQKKIKQRDGVETTYHRILFIQITVNRQVSIAVESYVDEESRNAAETADNVQQYNNVTTYETEYDENMNIKKAYQYLKKLDIFADASDV